MYILITIISGLSIWRIEKFKVVPWPKEDYGKFYSGDSYIVLNTYKKNNSNCLYHDIHFWLGSETTKDESGTAAYKTVELDNYLGTDPVEHREVQGYESRLFISYFKQLIIMEGGIDSGFNIVKPVEYKPQLFHIKAYSKTLTCTSVPVTTDSLNSGDVFVLDKGLDIYQWNGSKCSGVEKYKAMEFTSKLKGERFGRPKVVVFDQDDSDSTPFWEALGGKVPIKDDPDEYEDRHPEVINILIIINFNLRNYWKLSDASGHMEFKEEARNNISLSMLDPDDVFVVDAQCEIFVWIGHGSTVAEKTNAFKYALDYIMESGKPLNIPITRIVEGNEDERFKSFFS
ncbi:hypothetical protein PIROE2DRAFT_47312 [Piromyces sp. E2]|nr:hypothetical protein PIROE2DRAFT_47312 [Piromyces sp. E2]|eukprot:OUM59153.1 hypothetical protein PIROE2DRAFT_47312 [Piromyces sp. E2]